MKVRPFILSAYGWKFWLPALLVGGAITAALARIPHAWPGAIVTGILTAAFLAFFRDFPRRVPTEPGLMVSPADGTVTEITPLDHDEHLGVPTVRVGIFLSVLSAHVNRMPCDGVVLSTKFQPGLFLDARHKDSGPKNQSNTVVLGDPQTRQPMVVVKQIVGAIARRIFSPVEVGEQYARGERFGMIAFGSRTELYLRQADGYTVTVKVGDYVYAGRTVMARKG